MTGEEAPFGEFKAKVAPDAVGGEQTVAQLAAKHGIRQTMINVWKKQAIEGMANVGGRCLRLLAAEELIIGVLKHRPEKWIAVFGKAYANTEG